MGQGLVFTVDNSSKPSINLTGGPLSYKYEWHQMTLHFGLNNQSGSEHMIGGRAFPAEVSFMGGYRVRKKKIMPLTTFNEIQSLHSLIRIRL